MDCVHCNSARVRKNGHTHYGKQNYLCVSCNRQFVEGGQDWFVDAKERKQIERLFLERISMRGICRVMEVSISWLLRYLKEIHSILPADLNIVESLPETELYLDDRFDEEVYRILAKKKDSEHLASYTDFTNEACMLAIEEFDNELLTDSLESTEVLQVEIENDILMQEVYTQERGLRVEFLGIQLDELWSFVGNKENKQWVWLALNPANRQIIGFHVGGRGLDDAKLFHDSIPIYFRENAAFFSDYWQPYVKAFTEEDHFGVGKHSGLTNYIERFNCTLRQRISRLVRSALSFSKSIVNHVNAIKQFICAYNLEIKTLQI